MKALALPGEEPFAPGINRFQLVKDGAAWQVTTILWDAEKESTPLAREVPEVAVQAGTSG
jgi:hypothetical protein